MSGLGAARRSAALVLLCLAQFMVILDTTIVNVALPAIGSDVGLDSRVELQYVVSLYALTFGGTLIVAGRMADRVGGRRLFTMGLVGFAGASLICGLATGAAVLFAARIAQGVASAMISASALALLMRLFTEGAERNRALGAWGAVGGAAGASGLILGGALTQLAGWPWIFYLNVPVGLFAAIGAQRLLPGSLAVDGRARSLDLPGAMTITSGLGLLMLALAHGGQVGFAAASVLVMLAGGVTLLVAFIVVERRVAVPLVRFEVLRVPGLAGANVAAFLVTTIVSSNLFFTTLYVQEVLGFSPLQTGLAFLPNSALVVVGSTAGSRLAERFDVGTLIAVGAGGLGLAVLLLSRVSPDGSYLADVLPGFALTGLGLGIAFVAVTIAATRETRSDDHGLASGLVNTAQQIGFAVGIAAVVALASALSGATSDGRASDIDLYTAGYLLDAAIAGVAVVVATTWVRAGRRRTSISRHRAIG